MPSRNGHTRAELRRFLADQFHLATDRVELIGEGAWSRAYGFTADGRDLVVRVGDHPGDFAKDLYAQRFARPELPIPEVIAHGTGLGTNLIVTSRAAGHPLEDSDADQWRSLMPNVVGALETMRTTALDAHTGWGRWDGAGQGPCASWHEFLLTVEHDRPGERLHGWRAALDGSSRGRSCFAWALGLLGRLDLADVPRCLVHADLINRNVHVQGPTLTGVFDWGGALYGDHLYELAWLEMWRPWHTQLDVDTLRDRLTDAWTTVGYRPDRVDERLVACWLHIGVEHLAYNAMVRDEAAIGAVAARTELLVGEMSG